MSVIKAKIVAVMPNQREFTGTSGKFHLHGIVYEGSSEVWEFTSNNPVCTEFVVGQEASFTIETGTNAKGYPIKKIKIVKDQASGGGGGKGFSKFGGGQKSPETEALIVLQSCFAAVCNLNAQSSTRDIKGIIVDTNTAFEWMMKKAKNHVNPQPVPATPVAPVTPAHVQPVQQAPVVAPVVTPVAVAPTPAPLDTDGDGLPF